MWIRGGRGKTLIHKMWIKTVFFLTLLKFWPKLFSINTNWPNMRNGCHNCDYKVLTETVLKKTQSLHA